MPVKTRTSPRASFLALSLSLLAGVAMDTMAAPAATAQWQAIADQAGSTVAVDKSRISRLKAGKTAAWTQLTLDHAVLDFEGRIRYNSVQALNHYDCANASFATQRRVFLLDGREVKSEKVSGPPITVKADSVDAQLLKEVCKPRTVGEMHEAANRAAAIAAAANEARPRPMHAEMVSSGEVAQARSMKVADATAPAAAPAAPASADAKPRMFNMPLIDKSKAEDPYKGTTPPAAPPAAATAAKPAYPAPAAVPAPRAPAVAAVLPARPPMQELSRQEREMMLATSGPRKMAAPKKKAEEAPAAPDFSQVRWGYAGLGAPENWGKLPGGATCGNGKRQSPIDIRSGIKVDLEPIQFDYRPSQFRVIDNGHTVQVDVGEGSSITVLGRNYPLLQFHFHRPSEERVNGKAFDMVAHFVHKDFDNNTAVVAVLLERGMENPAIQTVWNYLPLEIGLDVAPPDVNLDLAKLLPEKREYYTYMGSLTTPPCSENVMWMVLKQPMPISQQQIGIFARLYPHNARPVQPTHDRLIKESR